MQLGVNFFYIFITILRLYNFLCLIIIELIIQKVFIHLKKNILYTFYTYKKINYIKLCLF